MTAPSPATLERIPAWVDKARLCFELCLSDTGVDDWVKHGVLPPPRKLRGKLMWKWKEVEARLENGGKPGHDPELERGEAIYAATKSAFEARDDRKQQLRGGDPPVSGERQVPGARSEHAGNVSSISQFNRRGS